MVSLMRPELVDASFVPIPARCSFVKVAQARITEETASFAKKETNSGRESSFS